MAQPNDPRSKQLHETDENKKTGRAVAKLIFPRLKNSLLPAESIYKLSLDTEATAADDPADEQSPDCGIFGS